MLTFLDSDRNRLAYEALETFRPNLLKALKLFVSYGGTEEMVFSLVESIHGGLEAELCVCAIQHFLHLQESGQSHDLTSWIISENLERQSPHIRIESGGPDR